MTLESLNGKIILCETLYRYIIERKRMKNIGLYICAYYTYIYIYTYKEEGEKMNLLQSCVRMLLQIVFKHCT